MGIYDLLDVAAFVAESTAIPLPNGKFLGSHGHKLLVSVIAGVSGRSYGLVAFLEGGRFSIAVMRASSDFIWEFNWAASSANGSYCLAMVETMVSVIV